ncbi:MAG: type II 3-dehydroquinate dehydratase [Hasllibacter sp.]
MATILMLNGPNLGLLGQRQPEVYGRDTLADVEEACARLAARHGHELDAFQTDHEGAMLERIHAARQDADAIVVNAGAWTHTSVALLDALSAFDGPVIEVHISQVHRREAFRHHSYVSARADAVIVGCGVQGYEFAVARAARLLD